MRNDLKDIAKLINEAADIVRKPKIFTQEDLEECTEAVENLLNAWTNLAENCDNHTSQ